MSEISQKTVANLDRIKSVYLEKRFSKSFVLLKRLFKDLDMLHKPKMKLNHTNYKYIEAAGKHFDKLTDHIQKKQVLKMISVFLKRFYRYLNFGLTNNQHDPIDVVSVQMTPQIFLRNVPMPALTHAAALHLKFKLAWSRSYTQLYQPLGRRVAGKKIQKTNQTNKVEPSRS